MLALVLPFPPLQSNCSLAEGCTGHQPPFSPKFCMKWMLNQPQTHFVVGVEGPDLTSRQRGVLGPDLTTSGQEQPSYDKKAFMGYVKPWLAKVVQNLPEDKKDEFKAKSENGIKYLLKRLKDLQL